MGKIGRSFVCMQQDAFVCAGRKAFVFTGLERGTQPGPFQAGEQIAIGTLGNSRSAEPNCADPSPTLPLARDLFGQSGGNNCWNLRIFSLRQRPEPLTFGFW